MKRTFLMFLSAVVIAAFGLSASASGDNRGNDIDKKVCVDLSSYRYEIDNSEDSHEKVVLDQENEKIFSDLKNEENEVIEEGADIFTEPDEGFVENKAIMELKIFLSSKQVSNNLLLVDKGNTLDSKYIPNDLVPINSGSTRIPYKKIGTKLNAAALKALNDLYLEACNSGITDFVLSSGYRSFSEQKQLYKNKVSYFSRGFDRIIALDKASEIVAPPGSSEHQTGLAIDVSTEQLMKKRDPLLVEFAKTACGKWMWENSWRFGFILRYPSNKTNITGIVYEPWHFRYIGLPHAEIMKKKRLCLEEYIKLLKKEGSLLYSDSMMNEYEITYISLPEDTEFINVKVDKTAEVKISRADMNGYVFTIINKGDPRNNR